MAMHVTRMLLKSRPSSFSTAVLRSAAVSNSTKLARVSLDHLGRTPCQRLTPRHCRCGPSPSRRRQGRIAGQSLSSPISRVHVSRNPGVGIGEIPLRKSQAKRPEREAKALLCCGRPAGGTMIPATENGSNSTSVEGSSWRANRPAGLAGGQEEPSRRDQSACQRRPGGIHPEEDLACPAMSANSRESPCFRGEGSGRVTDLPTGFTGKSADLHAVGRAPGTRSTALVRHGAATSFADARASGELDRQAFAHKVGSIF